MKIGFFTYFEYSLSSYYEYLKDHAECVWAVFNRNLFAELVARGEKKVVLCDNPLGIPSPRAISRVINKAYKMMDPSFPIKIYKRLVSKVNPDFLITDTIEPLLQFDVAVPKILAFHSVSYKQHVTSLETTKYDLIMAPGPYFKEGLLRLEPKMDPDKIRIVGWPRSDVFFHAHFSREKILEDLGLDPRRKTVLLAPSWNLYPQKGTNSFFPESWGELKLNFEYLCKSLQERRINFIIKPHSGSISIIGDTVLSEMAGHYGAVWLVKKHKYYNEDPRKYLFATDVLVSDVSGIILDYLPLDRPIIYIDIEDPFFWKNWSDLSKEDRCGDCVQDRYGLLRAIDANSEDPSRYAPERRAVREKALYKVDGQATQRACRAILDFIQNRSTRQRHVH